MLAGLPDAGRRAAACMAITWGWRSRWSTTSSTSSATEAELGKPVGSDLRQGTITLPVILCATKSPTAACGPPSRPKTWTCRCAWCRRAARYRRAYAEADVLVPARARRSKSAAGVERDALDALARYVTQRER